MIPPGPHRVSKEQGARNEEDAVYRTAGHGCHGGSDWVSADRRGRFDRGPDTRQRRGHRFARGGGAAGRPAAVPVVRVRVWVWVWRSWGASLTIDAARAFRAGALPSA